MSALLIIMLVLHSLILINAWVNWHFIRYRPKFNEEEGETQPSVSILVPARNESARLPALIESFRCQVYTDAELIIYDDESEDDTWDIIQNESTGRVSGLKGSPLPAGWVGKVFACHNLAREARGSVFVFLDADVQFLHNNALRNMVDQFRVCERGSVVTGMPRIKGGGLLIVSMVGHFILSIIPWWLGAKRPEIMAGLNGQCWLIEGDLYQRLSPHRAVWNQVLEDIMIGRFLHRKGITTSLVDLQDDLSVCMYRGNAEAWRGFRKNASSMLGSSTPASLGMLSIYIALYIAVPLYHPILFATLFILKWSTDSMIRQSIGIRLLAPVSYVLAGIVALDSIITRASRRIKWKGRTIDTG